MKKVFIMAVAAAALLMVSCNKEQEGVFNPKKKIVEVYDCNDDTRELSQRWNWDGDLLKSIAHYNNGNIYLTENMTYDKKDRLVKTDCGNGDSMVIAYEKKLMTTIKIYDGGLLTEQYTVKRNDDDAISGFTYKVFNVDAMNEKHASMLQHSVICDAVLPHELRTGIEKARPVIAKVLKANGGNNKMDVEVPISYTWTDNNITTISFSLSLFGENLGATYTLQYDNKKNPMHTLFTRDDVVYDGPFTAGLALSENNLTLMTSIVSEDGDSYTETDAYTYTYDGDYPTRVVNTYTVEDEDSDIDITEYVYQK